MGAAAAIELVVSGSTETATDSDARRRLLHAFAAQDGVYYQSLGGAIDLSGHRLFGHSIAGAVNTGASLNYAVIGDGLRTMFVPGAVKANPIRLGDASVFWGAAYGGSLNYDQSHPEGVVITLPTQANARANLRYTASSQDTTTDAPIRSADTFITWGFASGFQPVIAPIDSLKIAYRARHQTLTVPFDAPGYASPAPPWAIALEKSIQESESMLALDEDWDGNYSPRIERQTWERAVETLRHVVNQAIAANKPLPPPIIAPSGHGSIDIYWTQGNRVLLLNVPDRQFDEPTSYAAVTRGKIVFSDYLDAATKIQNVINYVVNDDVVAP